MRKLAPFLLALAAAAVIPQLSGCSAQQREAGHRERGARYLAEKNYEKARVELSNALQINPKDAQARYLAGQVAEKLGDARSAVGHYQAAIEADPSQALARAAQGRLLVLAGLVDKAMESVEAGLKLAPDEPHLLMVRGVARQRVGDHVGALQDAETAAKAAPGDEYVIALLSSLYAQDGKLDQAIAAVNSGLAHAPQNADLHYILVDLLQKAQRTPEVAAELKKIIEIEPQVAQHRFRLEQYQLSQRDVAGAEQTLRAAVTAIPKDESAKIALVQLLAQAHGAEAAGAQIGKFLAAAPDSDTLRIGFAGYYQRVGKSAEAEKLLRAAIQHADAKPEGTTARVQLAALRLAAKDRTEAAQLVDEVLKKTPTQPEALRLHAELAVNRGDAATAVTDLRAVLRDQPGNLEVARELARAHVLAREYSLAEDVLKSAQQLNPRDTQTVLQLLQVEVTAGKTDEALTLAQDALKRDPGNPAIVEQLFRLQAQRKDLKGAHASLASLQAAHPELPLGFYLAGLLDEAERQPAAALEQYDRALRTQPDAAEPLVAAVRLQVALQQGDKALARLDALIAKAPNNLYARNLKADVLGLLQRYQESADLYDQVIASAPQWWVPYRNLAMQQYALKKSDDAMATLEKGVVATGGADVLVTELANIYESKGRIDDAIKLYDDLLQRNPGSIIATNNVATLLANYRNDKASIERAAQLATALEKLNDPRVLDTRGWVAFRTGAYPQAEELLRQALAQAPNSALLHYRLAAAQLKTGKTEEARRNLEQALKSGQKFLGEDEARAALNAIRRAG
jgi:tetratricopeptide (TPR) repeat protein